MRRNMKLMVCASAFTVLAACGGDDVRDIVNGSFELAPLEFTTYPLSSGTYTAEVASSPNGVIVEWAGGSGSGCAGTGRETPQRTYVSTCTLTMAGHIMIANPWTAPEDNPEAGTEDYRIKIVLHN